MAQLLYQLEGVRGRSILIFDRKCVIATRVTAGSIITGNMSDGEKTIFYKDVVGVQFKKSGGLIGYLQFETGSVQMNNQNSNMFSENTFTFEHNKNGITNELMESIYHQLCDIIEQIKYGDVSGPAVPPPAWQPAPEQTVADAPAPVPAPAPAPAGNPVCGNCGTENAAGSKFCITCGTPLV